MTRTPPTTTWGNRTRPSSLWIQSRSVSLSFDGTLITFDSTLFTWDGTISDIQTKWNDPRYDKIVEDISLVNVADISGVQVSGITGNKVNVIDTIWN